MKRLIALALGLALCLASCGDSGPRESGGLTEAGRTEEFITVAAGPASSVNFPIGCAFATALKDYGYATGTLTTADSGENIRLIQEGGAELAIAMQDSVMQACGGFGAYEGKEAAKNLCALMRLWPNYVQLVTVEGTGIQSVTDLKGKRVGVGTANSGVELNARMIVEAYGMSYDDFSPDYLTYGEAIENMKNGLCDAVFVTASLPNATVARLAGSYDTVIVPIDGDGRRNLIEKYPCYAETVIPAGTYHNKEDVQSVFIYNIMLVRSDLADNVVYDMLTGIFENIGTIQISHGAAYRNIYLDAGVSDILLPLHPGAEKWWADRGFTK